MTPIRRRLLARATLSGAWLSLGSSIAAEIAGASGFDWLLFDLEHGTSEYSDLLHQLQATAGFPVASIVRVPGIDGATFKRVLDLGPHGLMVPNVQSAAQAEEIMRLVRVPPKGVRGAAQSTRASGYGMAYERYLREANETICVTVQIESAAGVRNAAAIAAVDGIDALFVGPTDLSIDLGTEANRPRGPFREAVQAIADAAIANGKAAGVLVRDAVQAADYMEMGYTFIALGSDRGLIASGMQRNAKALSEAAAAQAARSGATEAAQ
jgi:4-hydroxy-2-oxoheptanedioate aldolase